MTADRVEQDIRAILRAQAPDEAPMTLRIRVAEVTARPAAGHRPSWRLRPAWILFAAAVLLALLAAIAVVGSRPPDEAVVVVPAPSAMPALTIVSAESDLLATTRARPLPAQATCPPGSDPEAPGPAAQERPLTEWPISTAFDRRAGRVVAYGVSDPTASRTWTFDVCTNTWRHMDPGDEPSVRSELDPVWLAYDADSDRTVALTAEGQLWVYDLAADRWTSAGTVTELARPEAWRAVSGVALLYHDPSGLVIAWDGAAMWAYDVDTNTLSSVRQVPDPSRPAGPGMPARPVVFSKYGAGYDPVHDLVVAHVVPTEYAKAETWTFDARTGAWRLESAVATPEIPLLSCCGYVWPEVATRGVFDAGTGSVLFTSAQPGNDVAAFDAASRTWRTVITRAPAAAQWCAQLPPAYDPLNRRVVCPGRDAHDGGMSALSTSTWQWRWLLEPDPRAVVQQQ